MKPLGGSWRFVREIVKPEARGNDGQALVAKIFATLLYYLIAFPKPVILHYSTAFAKSGNVRRAAGIESGLNRPIDHPGWVGRRIPR